MKTFSWQFVALALGAFAMMIGASIWLIASKLAPASLLSAPFVIVFTSVAAYVKGKFEMPPWLTDPKINALVRSQPPPPGSDPLAGYRFPAASLVKGVPKITDATGNEVEDPPTGEVKP